MSKKYTTKQEIHLEIPYERTERDDTRSAAYQLKAFIDELQTPEKLRNAFNTLIRYQAVSADDGKFNEAYSIATERRDRILDRIAKL